MTCFVGKNLLITGGTGSFGRAFTEHLLTQPEPPARITIVSRDEQKQYEMALDLPPGRFPIRYCLGDVRDLERLIEVTRGVDLLVHAAAMKHVPAAEANPIECVRTNILGSYNVVLAARRNAIPRVVALSTDKAALPANAYGASKLLLERMFLEADSNGDCRFSVVRYANVFGSKGSVVPLFLKRRDSGVLPITNPEMTRFSITMADAINLVLFAIRDGWGGEVILPVAPSYRLVDVASAIAPEADQCIVGERSGEKIHEVLFSNLDAPRTVQRDRYYVITPSAGRYSCADYAAATGATAVDVNRDYNSACNDRWLSVADLRALLESEAIQF
jgi:UDP-N-acetylglucosamine 4,6-dehydratase